MKPQHVVSREYKVMLRPKRFRGGKKKLLKTADALWRDFDRLIRDVAVGTTGTLGQIDKRRLITFFDTGKAHLKGAGYIFRERRNLDAEDHEVTLKFRHPDHYVAQSRNMKPRGKAAGKSKFEEDIKADVRTPFISLYSFSTTLAVGHDETFDRVGAVAGLFPDIAKRVPTFRAKDALDVVNGLTARELVITGGSVTIGKSPKVDAECALIVWYDHARHPKTPLAVELSYRYGDKDGDYGAATALRAFGVFKALQTGLSRWVDPNPRTKTGLVYGEGT